MLRSRLLRRLYAGYAVIIVLFTLLAVFMINRQVTSSGMDDIRHTLASHSEFLADIAKPYFLNPDSAALLKKLQPAVVALGQKTNSRLTIIDNSGRVLADSDENPINMEDHAERPEILEARELGAGSSARYSQTVKKHMLYRAQRVDQFGKILGFVRVSLPINAIDEELSDLRAIVILSGGIAAVFALLLGLYFVRLLSVPLRHMTEAAEAMSKGNFEKRINIRQKDEIGKLAEALNRMAINSAQRVAEIMSDHDRLEKLLAGMVEGVIDVDEHENILHINSAACRLLNIDANECLGKPIWHEVRHKELGEALKTVLDHGGVVKTQMRSPSDKDDVVVDIYVAGLTNGEGDKMGVVIVLHDISDLDRLERIRRDFVANASHELKTPITAIRGLTETILDDPEMDRSVQARFVEKIHAQSLRLASLVGDLMTLSRLESSSREKTEYPVNLTEVVKRSVNCAQPSSHEKNIALTTTYSGDKVLVNGDMQSYSQLVDNLIVNAIKYTPNNGKVDVSLSVSDGNALLVVEDTGIGMTPHDQQKVFERFYRVDKARSQGLGGTGLGLSIVKNTVEQYGGEIDLVSYLGRGSKFTITLPLHTPKD